MNRWLVLVLLAAFHEAAPSNTGLLAFKTERERVLEAIRPAAEGVVRQPVKLHIEEFNLDEGWVLVFGELRTPTGKGLDWSSVKGCNTSDDKSMFAIAKKVDGQWVVKKLDVCDAEPAYWNLDFFDVSDFPCDLFRGLRGVHRKSPQEECREFHARKQHHK